VLYKKEDMQLKQLERDVQLPQGSWQITHMEEFWYNPAGQDATQVLL
jgi:hypothetical protein